ncbi:intradiol ring-cleavage dioxygenase [Rudaea sp.]|uniref:intradiol ring-cleavage dioxygenase n=1 Tax=Rudaea sp. TaxID=2136325 RepID=UPI003220005E
MLPNQQDKARAMARPDSDENATRRGRRRMLAAFGALPALPLLGELIGRNSTAVAQGAAGIDIDQQGLTGAWYDPATSGQGFLIEVFPTQNIVFGAWYTYDAVAGGATAQRWYTFSGTLAAGATSASVTFYQVTGGNFNAAPTPYSVVIGEGTLSFASCTSGSLDFSFSDGRAGSIPLARLMSNIACAASGGSVADANFALSGTWYNKPTSGQGVLIEVNPSTPYVFLSWFTFAPDGANSGAAGQRWFTGQTAAYVPGATSIALTLYTTSNGTFNSAATKVVATAVGSATLTYSSCGAAVLSYAFTSGEFAGQTGDITLQRTGSTPSACTFGAACALIPSETDGPYPLYSILSNTALQRRDITDGKTGAPLKLILRLIDVNNSCAPITNAAIYIWHCDKDGVYSGYANQTGGVNATGQSFLRGIQVTDASGQVVFDTIYPGWYSGRITHIHIQAYLDDTLRQGAAVITTQMAFPLDVTKAVYNSTLYAAHGQNTSVTSFAQDNVFSDGTTYEMATIAGDVANGYVATLTLGIAA